MTIVSSSRQALENERELWYLTSTGALSLTGGDLARSLGHFYLSYVLSQNGLDRLEVRKHMPMPKPVSQHEQIPRALVIHLNEYGQLRVKTRLTLTAPEVAELLTLSTQKVRELMYRREIPSFHLGSRVFVSLDALEDYIREREIEEQENFLYALERYYGYFRFGDPHPEIRRAQERLEAMQKRQGQAPPKGQEGVAIEAALYYITITEAGRLEC